jgi:Domain of unknown function (DUF6316)
VLKVALLLNIQGCRVNRKTDNKDEKIHFQMDRLVQLNGEWFYTTREGEERGPFESKDDAEGDMLIYIRHQLKMEEFGG